MSARPDRDPAQDAARRAKAGTVQAEQAADVQQSESPRPTPHVSVSVFNTKRIPGGKRLADATDPEMLERISSINLHEGIDLDEALRTEWETDAHFCMYHADDGEGNRMFARINKSAFVQQLEQAGGHVVLPILVFDYDLPKLEDGSKQSWSADSFNEFLGELHEAVGNSSLEPTCFYSTAHGARLVYVLDEPVDTQEAEAMMLGIMTEFSKRGIELDEACKDWTRLFRLPNVEREGHGRYKATLLNGGPVLRVADAPRGVVGPANVVGVVDQYVGDMPDPDECRALLEEKRDNGRTYKTELVKKAKQLLVGRDSYDIIFEHAPLVKGEENWNSTVYKIVGQVVGMMAREPVSTPEGIYALLHESVEQLQARELRGANSTDWFETVWDHVCRIWSVEEAQIVAERQEHEARQAQAREQRLEMVEEYREARPDDEVPDDEEEAVEWLSRRMIASSGSQHYVMRPDKSYNIRPCPDTLLIPTIRDLNMGDIIPTTEIRGKTVANRSAREIINDHALPITDIECSVREDVAYIDGAPGHRKLHIPIHRLNPNLEPGGIFDPRVDEWLRELGGDSADLLMEWLAHSLDVRRAICALDLFGASGTGKGLLALGISECFESMELNDGRALGKWNGNLLKSPLVVCDEGAPKIASDESLPLDQAFRTLVTGGKVTIRQMRTNPFTAELYPRILFTSNKKTGSLPDLSGGKSLAPADIDAIEQRLLSIEVTDAAQRLLLSKGNYDYTAGWVAGRERTRLVLANHIYYLYSNRQPSKLGKGRLLVEGSGGFRRSHYKCDPAHKLGVAILAKALTLKGSGGSNHVQLKYVHLDQRGVSIQARVFLPSWGDATDSGRDRPEAQSVLDSLRDSGIVGRSIPTSRGGMSGRWSEVIDLAGLRDFASLDETLDLTGIDRLVPSDDAQGD